MIRKISYSRQTIFKDDISNVAKVLKSDFITRGPVNEKFEKKIKDYVGAKYCLTTNSATSSLYIACTSCTNEMCYRNKATCRTIEGIRGDRDQRGRVR